MKRNSGLTLSVLCLFLFCLLLSAELSQAALQDLRQQETNLWSKIELSLLSMQNEIDGLQTLVASLQKKLEKLTGALELSQEDYNRLSSLQENTASLLSELSTNYKNLQMKYELVYEWMIRLIVILAVWIGVKVLRVIVGFKFPILDKIIPRWVDIII